MTEMFLVSAKGTQKCILWLDCQMLNMQWRIIQLKIRQVAKTMGKPDTNLCKQALKEGQNTCNGEDLLTECINICKKLEIPCVTEGEQKEPEVKLKTKKVLWRENDKEIKAEMMKSDKVRHLEIPATKRQRNYLTRMNLQDARVWFRFRCKLTALIKGNKSSMYKNNMECRYCKSGC